jgi:hypothetical protein
MAKSKLPSYQVAFDEIAPYRLSEEANPDRCQKCQSMIWRLICRTGFETKLDPERLNLLEATERFIAGDRVFEISRSGKSFAAQMLTQGRILHPKARLILAEHKCQPSRQITELPDYWRKPDVSDLR